MKTAKEALEETQALQKERERKRLEDELERKKGIPLGDLLQNIDLRIKDGYTFAYVYGFIAQEAHTALKEAGYTIYRAAYTKTFMCRKLEEKTHYSHWTGKTTKKYNVVNEPENITVCVTVISWDPTDERLSAFLKPAPTYSEI